MDAKTNGAWQKIFPITLYCCRDKGWSESAFRPLYLRLRPDDLYAYGYDVVIHSPTDVELVCFGMECAVYGGVGKENGRLRGQVDPKVTRPFVVSAAVLEAQAERQRELRLVEDQIVAANADAILAAITTESAP